MPQQCHIWDVALEFDDLGVFAYDEVDLSTMRQTSKTTTKFMHMVWRATRAARMWGPQRGVYTAQTRAKAREKLKKDFTELLLRSDVAKRSFREITNVKGRPVTPTEWKVSMNNGSEHLQFGRSNYIQIDAPTDEAGHGDTLDDGKIDEAWARRDDAVEEAIRPAQATRFNPQLWVGSTAGDERSVYWYGKVLAGRAEHEARVAALAAGGLWVPSRTCYFEWSIPDDADIDDEQTWWDYMPALGHTIAPEFIRGELERARRKPNGEMLWRRSYGNQWMKVPVLEEVGKLPAKIPAEAWKRTAVCRCAKKCHHRVRAQPGEITIGFSVSMDGAWSSIAIAAGTPAAPYVELIDHRKDTGWLPARLVQLAKAERPIKIGCNGGSAAASQLGAILEAFKAERVKVDIVEQLNSVEYKNACTGFLLDVTQSRLRHPGFGQGPLHRAAATAGERPLQSGFAFAQNDATIPIAPLEAAVIARALLPLKRARRVPLVATSK